ncbi:MAG: SDR family oxidoreductase [Chlamydiota bacterium]|nr:SDR family oxidoreductase [Chlamydiota bacterium]
MKIFLTGATGYIGSRLLIVLAKAGHEIIALTRSKRRIFIPNEYNDQIEIIEGDLLSPETLIEIPEDIDAAYYLVHSMSSKSTGFSELESLSANNFVKALNKTKATQIIYLSGLSRGNHDSEHMSSRHQVEKILANATASLTVLRAGIIVGSGSASFEIMRDLVEKLPIMIAPRWLYSKCQPIGVIDVLYYLSHSLGDQRTFNKTFEIGGPCEMTYKELLLALAEVRKLKRWIIPIPLLTPYLSSLWLFFVTSVDFTICRALINSLKVDAVCLDKTIDEILPHDCLDFKQTVSRAFEKIEQNEVVSSWKDAIVRSSLPPNLTKYIEVPHFGCLSKCYKRSYKSPKSEVLERLWRIGGQNGWYTMDWAWAMRGWFDRAFGGVGLTRGRTHPTRLRNGDVLDFWRVVVANKEEGHLLLYAEMKMPGEAWLEWKISEKEGCTIVEQTATFRPKGLLGRLYWYALSPIHPIIFSKMCDSIGQK